MNEPNVAVVTSEEMELHAVPHILEIHTTAETPWISIIYLHNESIRREI